MKLATLRAPPEQHLGDAEYYDLPSEHWRCLQTNNPLERLMARDPAANWVVSTFPDGKSALILVSHGFDTSSELDGELNGICR